MDIDPHPGVDFVGDVSDLSRFQDGSVEEIYASHILEHFSHRKTLDVLKEWNRVLPRGGILYVGVPDFSRTIALYSRHGLVDWIRNFLYGDQEYKTAFHYTCFDESSLAVLLMQSGFSDVSRVERFPFGEDDCSAKVDTLDRKPVSLNMVAVK